MQVEAAEQGHVCLDLCSFPAETQAQFIHSPSRPSLSDQAVLPTFDVARIIFKLHGPTARAGPATKILTIRDDEIKIICV